MQSKFKKILIGSISVLAISACSTNKNVETGKQQVSHTVHQAQSIHDALRKSRPVSGPSNITVTDKAWLGDEGIKVGNGEPLPRRYETPNGITLSSNKAMNLVEIALRVSEATNLRVLDAELVMNWDSARKDAEDIEGNSADDSTTENAQPFAGNRAGSTTFRQDRRFTPMEVDYRGPLSGLLDMISSYYGIDWEYKRGALRFIGQETRTFVLHALPGKTEGEASIAASLLGGDGGDSDGGTQAKTSSNSQTEFTINYWGDVEDTLKSIIPTNAFMAINETSGAITVTAQPSVLRQVSNYIENENKRLSRQVMLDVRVISVTQNRTDGFGFDLGALLLTTADALGKGLEIGYSGAAPLVFDGMSQLTISGNSQGSNPAQRKSAIKSVVQALNKHGDTRLVTSTSVTTVNNQPAPVSVVNQKAYVKENEVTVTDGNVSSSLVPGIINTGFSMNVLPRVYSDKDVMLRYNVTISELADLPTFTSSDSSIQIPEINARSFEQTSKINSGDTLVLAGFEREVDNINETGTGDKNNWWLGGGKSAESRRETMVILITPVVIEDNNQPLVRIK